MPRKTRSNKSQSKQKQRQPKNSRSKPKKRQTKKKMNKFMIAKEKARKANNGEGAESFVYNGITYVRAVTKTGMVIYKRS
jgi:hypothetical protein